MSVSTELTGAFYILWPPIFDTRNSFPTERSIFGLFIWNQSEYQIVTKTQRHFDSDLDQISTGGPWIPDQNQTVSVRLFLYV